MQSSLCITWDMNNNEKASEAQKDRYYEIIKWAAQQGLALTMHWTRDASVDELLSLFEKLNREVPIASLRWSIAHLNDASEKSLQRMKALGMGWTVQDAMYFGGEQFVQQNGAEAARRATGEYGKTNRCPCRRGNGCPSRGFLQS